MKTFLRKRLDPVVAVVLFVFALGLYLRTLAPSVAFLFDDTLEFQYIVPRLGIIHQTGYPFYALLGKLFTLLVPLNDPAFRLNLLSAFDGALAVSLVYFVARHLVDYRFAAILSASTFALGQAFWSQAVIAETYTTQMLIVAALLYLALIWREEFESGHRTAAAHRFTALAFAMGIGLTHHRLILLLYPAIALYILLVNRAILRDWKLLARGAVLFLAPLLLYLYLPIRGAVGSADGTYQNTFQGFLNWVLATQYSVFLTSNPLHVAHDASYFWALFRNQFGILGLALAVVGFVWLMNRPREWVLLVLALLAEAGFAFNYHVANVFVHFLTTFLLAALFVGAGADGLLKVISSFESRVANFRFHPSLLLVPLAVLLLLIPTDLLLANYATNDLSGKWDMHDYGLDMLHQPLERNAEVIGILGEMTLLRYFQDAQGLRPDVQTIAADDPGQRLNAIADAMSQNRAVYLTRQLDGVPERYSLSSLGPLIRVQPAPATTVPRISHPLDADFGPVRLLGYDLDLARLNAIPDLWHTENDRFMRVTLYWQPVEKMQTDAAVSLKVLRADQRVFGQVDHRPVLGAYPTTDWRPGEIISDTYAVPLYLGTTPGDYVVNVTLYDANGGTVIGQQDLQKIALRADVRTPQRSAPGTTIGSDEYFAQSLAGYSVDSWNISQLVEADLATFSLAGFSLDTAGKTTVRPGDALPLTLLWRAGSTKLADDMLVRTWLEDSKGQTVASRDAPVSAGYPPSRWQANSYVRDWPLLRVPANVADGVYEAKLAVVSNNQLRGSALLPFSPTIVNLGRVEIKNRPRQTQPPSISNPVPAVFDDKIKLLGYDLARDVPQRGVRLTLYWKSLALMDTSYTVFVHLLDGNNNVLVSADAVPGSGDLPTTGWIENEFIADIHAFTLPPDLPDGGYPIEIGLYDPITGARLKTADGQDHLIVTSVNIP